MPSTGVVKVVARTQGRVEALLINEGDEVAAGQLLYRLSGERYDGKGLATLATLKNSLAQQYQMLVQQQHQEVAANNMQIQGLRQRVDQLKEELRSADEALKLTLRQAALTRSMMERYQRLVRQKYVSELEYQQKQIELAAAEGYVENQRQVQQRLKRELTSVETDQGSLLQQGQSRRVELDRLLQGIRQQQIELQSQEESTLVAPVAGRVGQGGANGQPK